MLEPMLASLADAPLDDANLVYEPKYDGIRAIADVPAGGKGVRLWSRLGNDKTAQFPEVADALAQWAQTRRDPVVLDGEIVALDAEGRPAGFQNLQGRIHIKGIVRSRRYHPPRPDPPAHVTASAGVPSVARTALILFDVLRDGQTDVRERPLTERRAVLEGLFDEGSRSSTLRVSEQVRGDGRALYARAHKEGWEGLIAKRADSKYRSGKRSPDWRKLKFVHQQEFVIGGWTEPRQSRTYFGALLLGVHAEARKAGSLNDRPSGGSGRSGTSGRLGRSDGLRRSGGGGTLMYVAHVGTGFDERELARVQALLKPLEIAESPFVNQPPTNERPHWVKPVLVAQVKFSEWTADGNLRHPVYLGLRDDKKAEGVRREPESARQMAETKRGHVGRDGQPGRVGARGAETATARTKSPAAVVSGRTRTKVRLKPDTTSEGARAVVVSGFSRTRDSLIEHLRALEDAHRDGELELPDDQRLKVTNLHKVFWPRQKITKGDLFRYYVEVAPFVLPAIADRPLVMKRYPNGIAAAPFYQHRAEQAPAGIRIEPVAAADRRPQIIGGDLITLLYTTQLAALSQDPWFSRVESPQSADYVALDLDPPEGVPFARVLDVARWIHDELDRLGIVGVAKTSGADGLHVYIPLAPDTPYEAGLLFAQIVATLVAEKHPKFATTERSVKARGSRIYVDYLQNIMGKTLASAYSARASEYAGVSTPVSWKEVDTGVNREDFTIATLPARLREVGDLWAPIRKAKGADLSRVAAKAGRASRR